VWRFRSPHHSRGEFDISAFTRVFDALCELLNQGHTRIKELLVSFDSEVRIGGPLRNGTNFGIGTLASIRAQKARRILLEYPVTCFFAEACELCVWLDHPHGKRPV
jgi:hypothetical protein